jgi:hypothetical protein
MKLGCGEMERNLGTVQRRLVAVNHGVHGWNGAFASRDAIGQLARNRDDFKLFMYLKQVFPLNLAWRLRPAIK